MRSTSTPTITCLYRNETTTMQIIRLDESPEYALERTVLPAQCLWFEAPATAALQIHSVQMMSAIWEDTIPCHQLYQFPKFQRHKVHQLPKPNG